MQKQDYFKGLFEELDDLSDIEFLELLTKLGIENCPYQGIPTKPTPAPLKRVYEYNVPEIEVKE